MSSKVFCQRSMPAAILLETFSRFIVSSSSSGWEDLAFPPPAPPASFLLAPLLNALGIIFFDKSLFSFIQFEKKSVL